MQLNNVMAYRFAVCVWSFFFVMTIIVGCRVKALNELFRFTVSETGRSPKITHFEFMSDGQYRVMQKIWLHESERVECIDEGSWKFVGRKRLVMRSTKCVPSPILSYESFYVTHKYMDSLALNILFAKTIYNLTTNDFFGATEISSAYQSISSNSRSSDADIYARCPFLFFFTDSFDDNPCADLVALINDFEAMKKKNELWSVACELHQMDGSIQLRPEKMAEFLQLYQLTFCPIKGL